MHLLLVKTFVTTVNRIAKIRGSSLRNKVVTAYVVGLWVTAYIKAKKDMINSVLHIYT